MMIVGQVSTPEEATEIEFIAKSFVVAHRVKALVHSSEYRVNIQSAKSYFIEGQHNVRKRH